MGMSGRNYRNSCANCSPEMAGLERCVTTASKALGLWRKSINAAAAREWMKDLRGDEQQEWTKVRLKPGTNKCVQLGRSFPIDP
jgi:hypothetical protein